MFFKQRNKKKSNKLKPISTENLFIAECVVLKQEGEIFTVVEREAEDNETNS